MSKNSNELKPCPFCGGPAKVKAKYSKTKCRFFMRVVCLECGATSRTFSSLRDPGEEDTTAKEFIITLWNNRAEDSAENKEGVLIDEQGENNKQQDRGGAPRNQQAEAAANL